MTRLKPLPPSLKIPSTLAQRVFQLREYRNLTVRDLAKSCRFSVQRIEDIEAGIETWLSTMDRQLLAKALSVEPNFLLESEVRPQAEGNEGFTRQCQDIYSAILAGQRDLICPACQGPLKCSIQDALDLEGVPMRLPKAFCLKCPFVLA